MGCCCSITEQVLKAVAKNDVETLEWLVRHHPQLTSGNGQINTMVDRKGNSLLMIACKHGHIETVKFLVDSANCNVNFTRTDESPLHVAAEHGEATIITFLLERGANALQLTTEGKTAVDYARDAKKHEAVRALERYSAIFAAQLRMRRSSALQAGVGWLFGQMAKQAFIEQTGSGLEERDCWVVLTNANVFACEICPMCHNRFSSNSTAPLCQHCNTDFSGNHLVVTTVRELAIYTSQSHARPEQTFTFGCEPIPTQQENDGGFIVSVLRINDHGRKARKRRSNQVAATMASISANEYKKLVFVGNSQARQRFAAIFVQDHPAAITAEQEEDQRWQIPAEYLCPISKTLMRDPVVTCDGITFERDNIRAHFAAIAKFPTSPVTGEVLASDAVIPNVALKSMIEEWKRRFPEAAIVMM